MMLASALLTPSPLNANCRGSSETTTCDGGSGGATWSPDAQRPSINPASAATNVRRRERSMRSSMSAGITAVKHRLASSPTGKHSEGKRQAGRDARGLRRGHDRAVEGQSVHVNILTDGRRAEI